MGPQKTSCPMKRKLKIEINDNASSKKFGQF